MLAILVKKINEDPESLRAHFREESAALSGNQSGNNRASFFNAGGPGAAGNNGSGGGGDDHGPGGPEPRRPRDGPGMGADGSSRELAKRGDRAYEIYAKEHGRLAVQRGEHAPWSLSKMAEIAGPVLSDIMSEAVLKEKFEKDLNFFFEKMKKNGISRFTPEKNLS